MKHGILICPATIVVVMLAAVCELTFAQGSGRTATPELYELTLELGVQHSDNRPRTDPPGPSETALVPRAILDLSRSGHRMSLRAAGHVEQRIPLDGPFGNEFLANMAARLNWHLIPESLDWVVENVTSGAPRDLTEQDTPENRQHTNVFSTGPQWTIRPAAPWSGLLDMRYIHSYAEDSDAFDSDRVALTARALRRLGGGRLLSAGVEATGVRYHEDEFAAEDYDRLDLVGRYRTTRAELDMDIAAGRTRIDVDRGERFERNLVRLRLIWNIDDRHRLVTRAGHELSDSVRQLATGIEQLDLPLAVNRWLPVGNVIYVFDHVSLGWLFRHDFLDTSLTVASRDYQFELDPLLDFEDHAINLGLIWRLGRTMALESELRLQQRRFQRDSRRDNDGRLSLFLTRQFNPRWSGRIGAVHFQRDSNIVGQDSRENIVAVYLAFHAGR